MNEEFDVSELENSTTEGEGTAAEMKATEQSEEKKKAQAQAAWETFTAAVTAHAQALGLEVKDQVGYVQYLHKDTGHKVYVAKQARNVKRIDTTMELIGLVDGASRDDLDEKPVGKIACRIPADLNTVTQALEILASGQLGKIRAPKRAPKAETPAA